MLYRVRFLETRTVARKGGPTYEQGGVYLLRRDQVKHWQSRNVIELLQDVTEELTVPDAEAEGETGGTPDGPTLESSEESLEEPDGSDPGIRAEHEPEVGAEDSGEEVSAPVHRNQRHRRASSRK